MNYFQEMKVVESKFVMPVPRLQLSPSFNACSEKMKSEMNAWLKEMFGTYEPVYFIGGSTLVVNPKQVAMLKIHGDM